MITNQDIICLSSQDWNDLWTRKQRFMQRFAQQGNRVLYIEAQASLASIGILRVDWRRAFRWMAGPRRVQENLYVATLPLVVPCFQMWSAINTVNNALLFPLLRHWVKQLGFRQPVLWTYNPHSEGLVGKLGEKLAIYECVDELSAAKGLVRSEVVQELEGRLIKKVDVVIVTHENLYRSKESLAREIHLIPNGAEVEHFRKACLPGTPVADEMKSIPHPIVGFLGSIQYWIDFNLLRYLALEKGNWSFVLIGPIGRLAQTSKIEKLPNVYLLGRKRYEDLPFYLKAFDVCLNPYVLDETAANCSPLKLYEYLATGKPVVSVDMPEARKFDGLISIGRDYSHILELLEEAMMPEARTEELVAVRCAAVAQHSWDCRFIEVEAAAEKALAGSSPSQIVSGERSGRVLSPGEGELSRKRAVRDFWDASPCGTADIGQQQGSIEFFQEIEHRRYTLESFIFRHAEFSGWKGRTVLEVGCGTGTDLLQFLRAGANAFGVDLSSRSVTLAQKRLNLFGFDSGRVVVADAESLPFPKDSFDLVYSWGVLHHTPDTVKALDEIYRVLRPGGEARVMLYHRRSLVALQSYVRFGLLRGRPFRGLDDIMATQQESPGTKVYTRGQARDLLRDFEHVEVRSILTPYDLSLGDRRISFAWLRRFVPGSFGFFLFGRGRKPWLDNASRSELQAHLVRM
jgi:SAM-dependent methyltransferase/glycosyltransferase involved in cell wall biosynthesis